MKKRLWAVMLAVLLLGVSFQVDLQAADIVEVPADQVDSVLYQQVDSNTLENWPEGPSIYSESGIVMDMDSGAILYAKNIDDKHYPASITKVLTALVALENTEMTDTVTFSWDDISFLEYGDAHIAMKEGEEISMEEAMYGMLLASANEVSHAIGSNTEGGYDNFINLMNEKSAELGCTNSHWVNTYGLHDEEHYTSARDMALISAAAFEYEEFRTITNTYQYVIGKTNLTKEKRYVHQNHKMIRDWDSRYYKYCVGGKTGYTDQALTTLVTFATKGNRNFVAVTLRTHGGGNNAYADTKKILNYAFKNFKKVVVDESNIGNEKVASVGENSYAMLPEGITLEECEKTFTAPTELGDVNGKVSYTYQGQPVGDVEVQITDAYYNEIHGIVEEPESETRTVQKKKAATVLSVLIIVICVVVVLLIAFLAVVCKVNYERKKAEERRREARRRMREEWGEMYRE